ncbi:hypothetical protein OH492_26850 [Vibrio chagasii]|nr:hypothetical protein [Vibrio chagasii]
MVVEDRENLELHLQTPSYYRARLAAHYYEQVGEIRGGENQLRKRWARFEKRECIE